MQMQKDTHGENGDGYQAVRDAWIAHFPEKPTPRKDNATLRGKVRTRMKSAHFRENYLKALKRAARSTFLHDSGFFDLYWFLQNDDNWQKCLNGKYDDRQDTRGSPVANPNSGPYAELEPWT